MRLVVAADPPPRQSARVRHPGLITAPEAETRAALTVASRTRLKSAILTASLLVLAACSSGGDDPAGEGPAGTNPPADSPEVVMAAVKAPLQGPITIVVTDGTDRMELVETAAGDRVLRSNEDDVDTEIRVLDAKVYGVAPAETSFAGRWYALDPAVSEANDEITPTSPLRELLDEALDSVFGYDLTSCTENDPTPEPSGEAWRISCEEGVDLLVSFDDEGRMSGLDLGDGYVATITYDAENVSAPSDIIPDSEFDAFSAEMIKLAATASTESLLEALSRAGQAAYASDTSLTDTQTADAAIEGAGSSESRTVTREGQAGVRVASTGPGFTCTGTVTFSSGEANVSAVTCS